MRKLQHFFGAVVLMFMLSLTAAAGVMDTPIAPPSAVKAEGDIATGIVGQMDTPNAAGDIHTPAPSTDSFIEAALNLVRGVLSLF